MASWSELQERDRLMHRYIREDPVSIVLHRPTMTSDGAGGVVRTADTILTAQTFAIYPFKRRLTTEYHYNPQTYGEDRVEYIHWILIYERETVDIQIDDYFHSDTDTPPGFDRLRPGLYVVSFISARIWDRGQAGLLFRG